MIDGALRAARSRVHLLAAGALPAPMLVLRGPTDTARVALTFDDGPDDRTAAYLELFDRLDVRVTFFLLGAASLTRPDDVRAIVARGHEIGMHGWSHRSFVALRSRELVDELRRADTTLPPCVGRRLVRPPRGTLDARTLLSAAASGWTTVMWSVDSDDCRTRSPEEIAKRAGAARAGDIVLLHEGQPWTLAALPAIVGRLRARGLEPVTVSELLGGS